MKKSIVTQLAIAAIASLVCCTNLQANSITLGDVSQVAVPGGTDFTYSYTFANSFLKNGDFFTINDFGLAAVVLAPAFPAGSWLFSQSLVGPNSGAPLDFGDNANLLNVTFTWQGGNVNLGGGTFGPFNFTLFSTSSNPTAFISYSTLDQSSGSGGNLNSRVSGDLTGPVVPDGGSTVALMGLGLAGLEFLRRRLRAS